MCGLTLEAAAPFLFSSVAPVPRAAWAELWSSETSQMEREQLQRLEMISSDLRSVWYRHDTHTMQLSVR